MAEQNTNTLNELINQYQIQDEGQIPQIKKCQAPYSHHGGDTSYHNALIYDANPSNQVSDMSPTQVCAMFINPIHNEMMPCPNYLKGACKLTSHLCHFSHGELVLQSRLREYREPDFSLVQPGYRVLVQHSDKLWHPAIVTAIHDKSLCYVKLESDGTRLEVELHNLLPLVTEDDPVEPTESTSKPEKEHHVVFLVTEDDPVEPTEKEPIPELTLPSPPSPPLECWEVPIKGVGWRLMARMGYVSGTGLGKHGEGRISPVKAVLLPPGKSLDHCMLLRENACGNENLLQVDRRLNNQCRKKARPQEGLTQQHVNKQKQRELKKRVVYLKKMQNQPTVTPLWRDNSLLSPGSTAAQLEEAQRLLKEHKEQARAHHKQQQKLLKKLKQLKKRANKEARKQAQAEKQAMQQQLPIKLDSNEDECILVPDHRGEEVMNPRILCTSVQNQDPNGMRAEQRRIRENFHEDIDICIECIELD